MADRMVAVLSGGLSHEREVSIRSGRRLSAALRSVGVTVEEWDADASLLTRLRDHRPDAVVVALHGGEGENGSVQAILEMLGVPYVGTDSRACRRAWDKPTAKAELARAGLATPEWVVLPHATFRELGAQPVLDAMVSTLGLPLMLKPDQGGSALGAQVVREAAELPAAMVGCLAYGDTVLAEQFIAGVEVAVTVVDGPDGPTALPAVEIVPESGVYDYTARYTAGLTDFHAPARLDAASAKAVGELAVAAHRLLGLRDVSRTDAVVAEDGTVYFLEVNVSPGLTETSLLPMAVEAAGQSLGEIYAGLIERAVAR
ncbi:D-alanine--D-alanine ligase family protein [Lentzea flava]|uniref:D-alanine--D-alanine ligase n=1 Tax=Lentzea flava TaxID=103732 RepID=A0ABQ2UE37_9PSEU|nr:D-alanine--D-alanine ligase [Lentzea flava]MCP2197580.1 D-alanine-D-alanine ligase [Lentzea flava]GGU20641.1 D-alanine--D-alanine ligase [Lentzea flava]